MLPFARHLPWRRSHGPFVRRHISTAASQTVLVLLARGNWRCPFASQKHTMRGLPRPKERSGHPNVAPRRPPFWPPSARLSRPSTKRSTKVAAVAGDGCRVVSGPGPRPDWGFDRRRRGTAAQASTCQEPTRSEACKLRRAAKSIWQMANIYIRRIGKTPSSPCPFVFTRHAAKV